MKILNIPLMVLGMIIGSVAYAESAWEPIVAWTEKGSKAYVDRNELKRLPNMDHMVTGHINIVFDNPKKVYVGGNDLYAKSVIRILTVNCEQRVSKTELELYFDIERPKGPEIPIEFIEYGHGRQPITMMLSSSALYNVFCPTSI